MSEGENKKVSEPRELEPQVKSDLSSIGENSKDQVHLPSHAQLPNPLISPTRLHRLAFPESRATGLINPESAPRKNTDFSVPFNNQTFSLNNDDAREENEDFNQIFRDQLIGVFHTDRNFKIVRAYLSLKQTDLDRIFYTRFEPTVGQAKANILVVHGYGHSGHFLEVG